MVKKHAQRSLLNFPFIAFLLFLLAGTATLQAQDTAHINVRVRVQQDAILLRWAASTPMAWKQCNQYGYRIERYTVVRNDELLPQAEKKVLVEKLAPRPLNAWEHIAQANDYAAIIAQALYGEQFQLTGEDAKGIAKIINLSQELEQRFTMSLYAADQNFEAACLAAWGWRDTDVKKGERYLYRIIPLLPEKLRPITEMGAVYTSLDEYEELPKPVGLGAIWGDKTVLLAWDYAMLKDVYNSYYIEKSADGKNYQRLDGVPVTNLNSKEDKPAQRMYYIDSVADNAIKYYYRVVGITAFGETGQPSDSIVGKGKQLLAYVPHITRSVVNDEGKLELEWEFDERGNALISGFKLNRSDSPDNGYAIAVADIKPTQRSLVFDKLSASNYFTISAVPKEGEPVASFPVLIQPVDSFPPAIPKGLKGTVDSAGVVTLTWNKNTEPDMLGYKLYRAQVKGEELMPLFDIALQDTVYRDTVDVKTLNRKVYYAVASLDMRYNHSDKSPVVELEKPDLLKPSPPVISGYRVKDEGIEISWVNSSDEGVVQHRIYRKEKASADTLPSLLVSIADTSVHRYVDTSAVTNVRYGYTLTAQKKNGLESDVSNMLTAFTNKPKRQQLVIDRFDAVVDKTNRLLKLTWNDRLQNVKYYELYKSTDGQNMSQWKTVSGEQHEVMDENLMVNVTYQYLIRAIMKDGKNTSTKELTIKY